MWGQVTRLLSGGAGTWMSSAGPQDLVGKIIGRGGENVQRINARTLARVTVNQKAADGSRRYVRGLLRTGGCHLVHTRVRRPKRVVAHLRRWHGWRS